MNRMSDDLNITTALRSAAVLLVFSKLISLQVVEVKFVSKDELE